MIVCNVDPFTMILAIIYQIDSSNKTQMISVSNFNEIGENIVKACYNKNDYSVSLHGYTEYIKKVVEDIKNYEKEKYSINQINIEVGILNEILD